MDKGNRTWLAVVLVLLAVILAGAGFIWSRRAPAGAIEITAVPPRPELAFVSIDGAVNVPGLYPVYSGDTLADLVAAAGGLVPGADASAVSLTVGMPAGGAQRVNINTAAAWLLAALPGIGEAKAGAIVAWREANGPFRDTSDIMDVPGIGPGLYDAIRDFIEVGE